MIGWWDNWRTWPRWQQAWDHGPTNVNLSACFSWQRVNFNSIWDWSHGTKLDWKGMLNDLGRFPFWLCYLVGQSSSCGPRADGTRWLGLKESWQELFTNRAPDDVPLVTDRLHLLIRDAGGMANIKSKEKERVEDSVWRHCRENPPIDRPLAMVNLVRFWDSHCRAKVGVLKWTRLGINFTHYGLEDNLLGSKKLAVDVIKPPGEMAADRETTDPGVATYDAKAIRAIPRQAIVAAAWIYGDDKNLDDVNTLVEAADETWQWHSHQNKFLRSSPQALEWIVDQTTGGFSHT